MLYDENHPDYTRLVLVDWTGNEVPLVKSFDDVTKETKMYIRLGSSKNGKSSRILADSGEPVVVTAILKEAKIMTREQFNEIKSIEF